MSTIMHGTIYIFHRPPKYTNFNETMLSVRVLILLGLPALLLPPRIYGKYESKERWICSTCYAAIAKFTAIKFINRTHNIVHANINNTIFFVSCGNNHMFTRQLMLHSVTRLKTYPEIIKVSGRATNCSIEEIPIANMACHCLKGKRVQNSLKRCSRFPWFRSDTQIERTAAG